MVGLQHTPRRPAIASLRDNERAKERLHAAKPQSTLLAPLRTPPTAPVDQAGSVLLARTQRR